MAAAGVPSTPIHVPHYDIYGHQHHRHPFKDKAPLLKQNITHPRWLEPPTGIRSRSELLQARKQGRIPDSSYDFDGDGVVGNVDFFIGRSFDKDCDGVLSPSERRQAEKALENGFLEKYKRGLEATAPPYKNYTVRQKRGVVVSSDNTDDISKLTFGAHHNAHVFPKHSTKTALELSRLGELKGAAAAVGEHYADLIAPVYEPRPPDHRSDPRTCEISNIRERAEADHHLARYRAGLLPVPSMVNPERENREVGMGYQREPAFKTRSQLNETRKEAMKQQCEELCALGNEVQVPLSVRRTQVKTDEYDFRRAVPESMTHTKLKDQRRREKIEYEQSHFAHAQREYPRFSDREHVPFWIKDVDQMPAAPSVSGFAGTATMQAMPRSLSEPHFKITEIPFAEEPRETHATMPEAAFATAAGLPADNRLQKKSPEDPAQHLGSSTKKRWTTDMLERGQARNRPRLFDTIQPLRVGPKDLEPLELTSAMEPIRNAAMRERAAEQKRNATNPRRSQLWRNTDSQNGLVDLSAHSAAPVGASSSSQAQGSLAHLSSQDGAAPPAAASKRTLNKAAVYSVSDTQLVRNQGVVHSVETTAARDPKSFTSMTRAASSTTGVRCGGFHVLDRTQAAAVKPENRPRDKHDRTLKHAESKEQSGAL